MSSESQSVTRGDSRDTAPRCELLAGTLHVHVAFDIGGEVNLDRARQLVPAESQSLPRRPRTPSSIAYRPPPLRFRLPPVRLALAELGEVALSVEATLFDFGAVSVALRAPFSQSPAGLVRLARALAEPSELVHAARQAFAPVYTNLLPSIHQPVWSDLTEEYFVFQVAPEGPLPAPAELLAEHGAWLAGLVRLEDEPLSPQEIEEALKSRISYGPRDLFVAEWSAAFLLDQDCGETLQIIEFANLQLLEFRFLDEQLDRRLGEAYRLIHPVRRSFLPFWRTHALPLRALGELRMEANDVFERTGNVLKLVGDQYLARVYRLLAGRFHLETWERSIERSLRTMEDVYSIVSDRADTFRAEFMEVVIIVLIALEIILALFKIG
ncbi:MAG TPA: hypothetical protein VHD36_05300 [Pirellulales bacterium]|nr:hypothetical protein [Pirellulales bacterium]